MFELGIHAWYSWCVATRVILATGVQAQDANMLQDNSGLPLEGLSISQGACHFKTFDCNEPEDALIQNPPHSCAAGVQETQPQDLD